MASQVALVAVAATFLVMVLVEREILQAHHHPRVAMAAMVLNQMLAVVVVALLQLEVMEQVTPEEMAVQELLLQ
jgi:hypothetical protein